MGVFKKLSQKKKTLNLEDFEKAFFENGFVLEKEDIKEIFNFLLDKLNSKNNTEV